jgi:hypothetical protein
MFKLDLDFYNFASELVKFWDVPAFESFNDRVETIIAELDKRRATHRIEDSPLVMIAWACDRDWDLCQHVVKILNRLDELKLKRR